MTCQKVKAKNNASQLLENLIKKADDALYQAKETGRDKVVCSDELNK